MKRLKLLLPILAILFLGACSAFYSKPKPEHDVYAVNVNTFLNVRKSPSRTAAIVSTLNRGQYVEVWELNEGWARISEVGGAPIGYTNADYLVLFEEGQNPPASNGVDNGVEMDGDYSQSLIAEESQEAQIPDRSGLNVSFMGDSIILSQLDCREIANRLKQFSDYTFVVNAASGVPAAKLFDYAPDLLDDITDEMDSELSWWQTFKSWFGAEIPSSKLVLLSMVQNPGQGPLLQAECNGNSLKYLKIHEPEKYFRIQADGRHDPSAAIAAMGNAIADAGKDYKSRNWFIRGQIQTGNIFENICDGALVENILPRDSFWHKWVFGWIFAWPFAFANWVFSLAGSYLFTIILFMLCIVALDTFKSQAMVKFLSDKEKLAGSGVFVLTWLPRLFLWLAMLSLLVYMVPDMTNISVMAESGYSSKVVECATHNYLESPVEKSWLLVVLFIVGTVIAAGVEKSSAAAATLPEKVQRFIYRKDVEAGGMKQFFSKYELEDAKERIEKSDRPYKELTLSILAEKMENISPMIVLAYVLSGSLLLYLSLFLWTKALDKIIFIFFSCRNFHKMGLYRK